MQGEFEMSMIGELKFFLRLQIKKCKDGIFINQTKYAGDILKKFGMDGVKSSKTPMSSTTKLNKDENGKPVDEKCFRGTIGSLLYLMASSPNIMFSTCLCAHFQSSPRVSHLNAIKRIFKYLSGSLHLELWYPRNSSFDLISYSDVDFVGSLLDRKKYFWNLSIFRTMLSFLV